jgi:hypothetical protein
MRNSIVAFGLLTLVTVPVIAAPISPPPSATGTNLPIQRVTLYTSGVGYFERGGFVDGDTTETLQFPVGQINDVLKSLVLLDNSGGSIRPVTYAAQDPVARRLQDFSVDLSDNPDQATLLNRLRGTSVTVTTTKETVTGTIVGVETQTISLPNNAGTTQQSTLNLDADDGLHSLVLSDIGTLKINDPTVNAELSQALAVVAQGRDAGKRPVTLAFDGHGRRSVTVGYLTETPLWQTTYRLVLGKSPVLQGWALVQNTGQDDWNNIHLTLASGQPISFIQDLYTPQYVPRPTIAPRIASSPTPQTYASNLDTPVNAQPVPELPISSLPTAANNPAVNNGAGTRFNGAVTIVPNGGTVMNGVSEFLAKNNTNSLSEIANQSIATNGAKLGTALFTYAIKVPVSVPRGQSAMIPFVSGPIQATPVAIYDPNVLADHPLSGARLKNTTGLHLMGGPLTVFDTGANGNGYVGDALIDDTEPGQTRLISYAVDLAVDAQSEPGAGSGEVTSLVISQGILRITTKDTQSTIYTFKNNSNAAQTIVVESPNQGDSWHLLEPATTTERTAEFLRFDVPVAAGASKKFTVREEYPQIQTYGLLDTGEDTLLVYIHNGAISPAVKAALQEAISRRRAVADTQAQITDVKARIQAISDGQTRIRDNMKALDHASALYKRYVSELNTQETMLTTLQSQLDTLQAQLAQQQAALNDYVAHLNVT